MSRVNIKQRIRKIIYKIDRPTIHKKLAKSWMRKQQYKKAVYHWEKAYEIKSKFSTKDYVQFVRALRACETEAKVIQMLKRALKQYRANEKLTLLLTDVLFKQKDWKEATSYLLSVYEQNNPSIKVYIQLIKAYDEQQLFNEAEAVLQQGKKQYTNKEPFKEGSAYHPILDNHYINYAIYKKEWNKAISCLNHFQDDAARTMTFENQMTLGMLYQIIGENRSAETIYHHMEKYHPDEMFNDVDGYRKITLYDNQESRIEFYKKTKTTDKVIVTFDSLYMNWNEPAFGFKLLRKQDVDIIAVRKRKKGSSQQDLSQKEFTDSVEKLVNGYQDKIAYGHSLGGYTALYYASLLHCRILSLAPRLSIHPVYGHKSKAGNNFYHQESQTYNDQITPIIVYDPKDKMDYTYVHYELLRAFPNAQLVQVPYGGHGMARHLLRMGVLKEYILKVIDHKTPKYDRTLKSKSANYFWVLGRKCLGRNKLKWAQRLADQAIQLTPTNRYAVKIKMDVLKRTNQYSEALSYAKNVVKSAPKDAHIRLMLIDIYIDIGDFETAAYEVDQASKAFKNKAPFDQKREKINKLTYQNTPSNLIG